jgi:hypothetical protein
MLNGVHTDQTNVVRMLQAYKEVAGRSMNKVLAQLAPPSPYPDTPEGAAAFEEEQAVVVQQLVQQCLAQHAANAAAASAASAATAGAT